MKKIIKLKDFLNIDKENMGLFLAVKRINTKGSVGLGGVFWTSLNAMEVKAYLTGIIEKKCNVFEHIITAIYNKNFDEKCEACKIAKKLSKEFKNKKIKTGSKECSEAIWGELMYYGGVK